MQSFQVYQNHEFHQIKKNKLKCLSIEYLWWCKKFTYACPKDSKQQPPTLPYSLITGIINFNRRIMSKWKKKFHHYENLNCDWTIFQVSFHLPLYVKQCMIKKFSKMNVSPLMNHQWFTIEQGIKSPWTKLKVVSEWPLSTCMQLTSVTDTYWASDQTYSCCHGISQDA